MASTVPSATIGATGVVVPTQSQILWGSGPQGAGANQGVMGDLNNAFGGNLNTATLSTPQGQLASSIAAYIADKNSMFSYFVSQTDPQYAQGFMQDALGRIFNITRLPATYTTVTCTCSGAASTVIPSGAQAQDTSGNLYTTLGGTIGLGGTVSLLFTAVAAGAIPCAAGTLTRIMTTTPGWDSLTNPTGTDTLPLTLGRNIESSQAFEARRQLSIYANAQAPTQSILGAVLGCDPNVVDCFVYDNTSGSPLTYGGITIPAYSAYIAVQGPLANQNSIANAVWLKKGMGCNYAPTAIFTASVTGAGLLTVTAITSGFLAVGQTINAGVSIVALGSGTGGTGAYTVAPDTTITGSISGTTLTVTALLAGKVIVGQTITGVGVTSSTYISALGTGTGGVGTYTVNNSQTVSSETISAYLPISSTAMTSATQITVSDTSMATPYPTYNVQWTTPIQSAVPVVVSIPTAYAGLLPPTYLSLITTAVQNAFLGLDGGPKARIGATLLGNRFYSPILAAIPGIQIANITVNGLSSYTPNINVYPIAGTVSVVFV
jgi:hypothetical protein